MSERRIHEQQNPALMDLLLWLQKIITNNPPIFGNQGQLRLEEVWGTTFKEGITLFHIITCHSRGHGFFM